MTSTTRQCCFAALLLLWGTSCGKDSETVVHSVPEALLDCLASCDDGNPCTRDACDDDGSCTHDGTGVTQACDDSSACTEHDVCQGNAAGTCNGAPLPESHCDDNNPCTADSCNPASGCSNDGTGITSECSWPDACTSGGQCAGNPVGTCLAGPPVTNGTPCAECTGSACACVAGACAAPVLRLIAGPTASGAADVDLQIDTSTLQENPHDLGAYDVSVVFDSTMASIDCLTGLTQMSPAFDEPKLNRCHLDTTTPAAARLRLIDVNVHRTAISGATTVKRLHFTNITGPQTMRVEATPNAGAQALLDTGGNNLECGGVCTAMGMEVAP